MNKSITALHKRGGHFVLCRAAASALRERHA